MSVERREHERYDVNIDVRFGEGENFLFSYIENISEMGIFIRSDDPKEIGTLLTMKFAAENKELEIKGRVVWVNPVKTKGENPNPGMGVEFEGLTEDERKVITGIIRTVAYVDGNNGAAKG